MNPMKRVVCGSVLKSRIAGTLAFVMMSGPVVAEDLASAPVRVADASAIHVAEAVVEAVRQSVVSTQVAGRVIGLPVKAGDAVGRGALIARIDAKAAAQQARASAAQVDAARAQLDAARKEFERQQQLFGRQYISQAARDQAEAQFKATEAGVRATLAQADAAATQTGFFTITAPFAGRIAELPVAVGDMALPGKPLAVLYDPAAMRIVASLPQSRIGALRAGAPVMIELPGMQPVQATSVTLLPAVDPVSHTAQVRLGLPVGLAVLPGMFARARFPLQDAGAGRLWVPSAAVLRRTELDAVYVISQGRASLRQVRLGERADAEIEVLAGLRAGERVALDPVAAAASR